MVGRDAERSSRHCLIAINPLRHQFRTRSYRRLSTDRCARGGVVLVPEAVIGLSRRRGTHVAGLKVLAGSKIDHEAIAADVFGGNRAGGDGLARTGGKQDYAVGAVGPVGDSWA